MRTGGQEVSSIAAAALAAAERLELVPAAARLAAAARLTLAQDMAAVLRRRDLGAVSVSELDDRTETSESFSILTSSSEIDSSSLWICRKTLKINAN